MNLSNMRDFLGRAIRICSGWPLFGALLAGLGFGVAVFLGPEPRYSLPRRLMAVDSSGTRLFVQDDNDHTQRGPVEVRDLATGRVLAEYGSANEKPFAVLSAWGGVLALIDESQTRLIDLATGRSSTVKEQVQQHLFAAVFDATESWAILDAIPDDSTSRCLVLVEVATGAARRRWRGDCDFLGFTKDGVVLRRGDAIEVIDPRTQAVTAKLAKPGWRVMHNPDPKAIPPEAMRKLWVEMLPNDWQSPKGKEALVGKAWENGAWHVTVHGLPKLDQRASIALALKCDALSVQVSSDGRWLLVFPDESMSKGLEVWEIATGRKRRALPANVIEQFEVVLAPDGSGLAVVTKERELQLLELPTLVPRWRRSYGKGRPFFVQFTADAQSLIVPVDTLVPAEILDAATGKPRNVVETRPGIRTEEAWIRTGNRFVCTYGNDRRFGEGGLTVWESRLLDWFGIQPRVRHFHVVSDVATGQELASLQVSSASEVDLTADGRYLVTNDWHKPARVRVWDNPRARPWRWIIGVPAGLGLMLLALRTWRKRRVAKQTA